MPTSTKAPAGKLLWIWLSKPQQTVTPSESMAHALDSPAMTDWNRPGGGVLATPLPQPQHAIDPSLLRSAHANPVPTLKCEATPEKAASGLAVLESGMAALASKSGGASLASASSR